MNIACPICDASYEVPESVLAARRPLRCARCGHDWIPGDDAPAPEPAAAQPEPPPEAVAEAPSADPQPDIEPEDDYDEYVAAKEPETITTAEIVLAAELSDEQLSEPAPSTAHPGAPFVPPRPIAPRPTLVGATVHPTPVQPRGAWIASLVTLAVLVVLLLVFHAPITRAWPPMAHLYGLVGM